MELRIIYFHKDSQDFFLSFEDIKDLLVEKGKFDDYE